MAVNAANITPNMQTISVNVLERVHLPLQNYNQEAIVYEEIDD